MLTVAWDSLGSNSSAVSPSCFCSGSHFISFVVSLSLLSPVWTETKRLQGKLQQSKLVCLSSSRLTVWLQTLCCWQRRVRAPWANQLVPTSPVAKNPSVDQTEQVREEVVKDTEHHWKEREHREPWMEQVNERCLCQQKQLHTWGWAAQLEWSYFQIGCVNSTPPLSKPFIVCVSHSTRADLRAVELSRAWG